MLFEKVCFVVIRRLFQFVIEFLEAHSLCKGCQIGVQVGSKTKPVSLDGAAHGCQSGGEQIHSGPFPVMDMGSGCCGVDKAVVHQPTVIVIHISVELAVVHGLVVAYNDHSGVFVERLIFNPFHKGCHLTAGAGYGLVIGLSAGAFFAVDALIAAHMMGIHSEHGESEGLIFGGDFR